MESYKNYIKTVEKTRPALLPYVHIIIAAITTLVFSARKVCITVWLIGSSSSGKGETIRLTTQFPKRSRETEKELVHRSDKFTENSFVSNRADVRNEKDREKLDLLRKLKEKVLITSELGAFLSGHKDKLAEKFGILTRVLDGEGLCTDTGAHGHRAVDDNIEFTWIGAATDLTPNKHEALSRIGGRVLTLDLQLQNANEEQLIADIIDGFPERDENDVAPVLEKFYSDLFQKYPRGTFSPNNVKISPEIGKDLSRLATVGALLRSNVTHSKDDSENSYTASREQPFRYAKNLHLLVRAGALLRGSECVDYTDLGSIVLPLVFSSGPDVRHKIFAFLALSEGRKSIQELVKELGIGETSVRNAVKELECLGLVDQLYVGSGGHSLTISFEHKSLIEGVILKANPVHLPSPLILQGPLYFLARKTRGERETKHPHVEITQLSLNPRGLQ